MIISEIKDFVLHETSFFFKMDFSKSTSNKDQTFPDQTLTIDHHKSLFFVGWYQISMPKVSSFHSDVKMNQQKFHLFIPLETINQQNVNSQISHRKLPHVCE